MAVELTLSPSHGKETVARQRRARPAIIRHIVAFSRVVFTATLLLTWYLGGRLLWRPYVVFQVYGTERDKRAYFPAWLERVLPPSFPIAVLRVGGHFGLVAGTMVTAEELDADSTKATLVLASATRQYRTRAIALAGRLPSLLRKAGVDIKGTSAVVGSYGTRYAMGRCARELATFIDRSPDQLGFAIIGAGFTGTAVAADMKSVFRQIVSLDTRFGSEFDQDDQLIETSNPQALLYVDVALVFTPKGDDAAMYAESFLPGTLIADDTHPCMKRPTRRRFEDAEVKLVKAVTEAAEPVAIFPRLPNFRAASVPGCLLEALVVAREGRACLVSYEAFERAAERTGFNPVLMSHPNDS